ncbi:MAG: aminopeptidase [candidate division KSB1 bacterium]|nr:aminopeptidase [candidate division KSB1 bacterium]MDZ7303153.1 aminopeptidase [candidate division KSB1 bacterium]MDZ7310133.1 aminopeptidase [candidate division KSB1 bacterium]
MAKMKIVKKAAVQKMAKTTTKKVARKAKAQPRKKMAAPALVTSRKTVAAGEKLARQLEAAAHTALETCLAVKPGETVVVITDEPKREIGMAIWRVAKMLGTEAMIAEILPRSRNGEEPPAPIAALMAASSVVLCPTSKSLTHTAARREACAHGARIATLPGVTEDMMIRCLAADYNAIAERSTRLSAAMESGNEFHITSPAGTDIRLIRGDRHAKPDTGLYHHPGEYGNLPAGETFFAPIEGSANGVVIFDGAMAGIGALKNPIRLLVRNGMAVEITGGPEAQQLIELIKPLGDPAYNIAELGIGTNDRAQITGLILEDEKVLGTVHIALGDNMSMGGTVSVPSHLDGLIMQPTVYVDGRMIMEAGKLLVT